MASRDGQSSMIERNEVMAPHLRQFVLNGKANMSADCGQSLGQNVLMPHKQARSTFLADFLGRTVAARRLRFESGREMAAALGWGEDQQPTYSKYETRTPLPHYLIPQFCKICSVRVEWLMTGEGPGPTWMPVWPTNKTRKNARKIVRAA